MASSITNILQIIFSSLLLFFFVSKNFQTEAKTEKVNGTENLRYLTEAYSSIQNFKDVSENPFLTDVQYLKHFYQNQNSPFFCGQLIGEHYMIGNYNFCGGINVNDCSAICFNRNFTYFQCEGNICHCFS